MKTPFAVEARFEAQPGFAAASAGGAEFLVGSGGLKVRIDLLGRRLWEALPGTRDELAGKLNAELAVGDEILDDFLLLFVRAGLVRCLSRESQPENPRLCAGPWTVPGTESGAIYGAGLESGPLVSAVSAVIVTRNGETHIRGCLDSLAKQDYRPIEILVVDNASSDGTVDIIRREYPSVIILSPGKNLFYPGGLNYGLARARGEFALVLNDDTELAPDVVGRLSRRLQRDALAAAVVPQLRLFGLRGFLNGIGNHVRETGWGSDNFVGCVDVGQFRDLREVPSACVSAALIRKAAWRKIGPFDAGYLAYYEDVDWSFRARLAGWTIAAEPEAVVYHKFSAYWKNMEGKLKLAARNRMRFVLKIFRGPAWGIFFKSYLKEDLLNTLSLLKKKRYSLVWAYVRAYASLFLSLPAIADSRRRISKASKDKNVSIEDILKLNPDHWSCLGPEGEPVLDADAYYGYYRGAIRRGR